MRIFSKAFPPSVSFFLLQVLKFYDTHPVKAKAFVAFEMPRPTTNFIWLWSEVCFVVVAVQKILFSRRPDCTHTTIISDFPFECIRRAQYEVFYVMYPSPACAVTTTISESGWWSFCFFRKRIFNVYVFAFDTPRRALPPLPPNFDGKFSFAFPVLEATGKRSFVGKVNFGTSLAAQR